MTAARDRSEEGFILVVVLVLLMALATLASIYSIYAGDAASESLIPWDRLRGEAVVRSGLELAALQLLNSAEGQRPSHGELEAEVGGARLQVSYRAENARVDLNAAPKEIIAGLLARLGAPDEGGFADRIIAWRTPADPDAPNTEPADYRAAALDYAPRQAPFNSLLELSLVRGLPGDLIERMRPYVTIYSGKAEINIAEADPPVVASLPGLSPKTLAAVLAARANGEDGQALISVLGPDVQGATAQAGDAYRAEIQVQMRNRRLSAEVVFTLKAEAGHPFEILDWKDDFDGAPLSG